MTSSAIEQVIARSVAVLAGATAAGANVDRGRVDAWSEGALPAINVRRASSDTSVFAERTVRGVAAFDIEFSVATSSGWETAVDALHMEAHAALIGDAALNALGRGLHCSGTDVTVESTDVIVGRLTAHYQMQILTRTDLTRALS